MLFQEQQTIKREEKQGKIKFKNLILRRLCEDGNEQCRGATR